MLKLLPPDTSEFHNFKCGEIYCVSSNNYNVACSLCGVKVEFEQFPQHFQVEHLTPKLEKNTLEETIKTDVDPIKSEEEYISGDGGDSVGFDAADSDQDRDEHIVDEKPFDFIDLQNLDVEVSVVEADVKPTRSTKSKKVAKAEIAPKEDIISSDRNSGGEDADINDDDWRPYESTDDDIEKLPRADDDLNNLPYPCTDCMRSYKTKRSLLTHRRLCHDPKKVKEPKVEPKIKCNECGELFRAERNLKAHMWKHTGIICDICGQKFSQTGNLQRHKIRHTGIKAHKCQECGNAFFTDKELKAHMLRHTGERPVICEICGKRCRDHGVYKAHMRRHTGERPAKCDVCGKAFYSFHDLNVHAVTHRPERPFACDQCGSTFQRKKSLRVHKKLHSKDRKHECKVCGKGFAQTGGLNAHMRSHDAALNRCGMADNSTIPIPITENMGNSINMGIPSSLIDSPVQVVTTIETVTAANSIADDLMGVDVMSA